MPSTPPEKVIILSSLYPPHLGGVEKYSESLAQALSQDFDVHVFCMNTEGLPELRRERSITVHRLGCTPLFNKRLPLPKKSALITLENFLSDNQVKYAMIQTRLYPFNLDAARLFKKKAIPFCIVEHGTGHVRFRNGLTDLLWSGYEHGMTAMFKQLSRDFYGVSQAAVEWLNHFNIAGKGILPNGIDPANFTGIDSGWRVNHQIPADAIVVVFAGRILRSKGPVDLLKACDKLNNPLLHVVIAGDGDMQLLTPWKDKEKVHILGSVPHSEMLRILKDAQIFCLPSAYPEGLPTVILEAGALRLPVIASTAGGIAEVIHDGETGLIIPARNPAELSKALARLIDNQALREELGRNLMALVLSEFTWESIAQKAAQIIRSQNVEQIHSSQVDDKHQN